MSEIDRELQTLSEWAGPTPELWRRALHQVGTPVEHASARRGLRMRPWMTIAAIAAMLMLVVPLAIVPSLGRARSVSHRQVADKAVKQELKAVLGTPLVLDQAPADAGGWDRAESSPMLDRQVVRKATIELVVDDVHAAIAKVRHLLSEAQGEYVETADVGASGSPRASLVLRVRAERLETIFSDLRPLGEVKSERVDAEDVTDQLVDVDARLANERRIEQELLELLETRTDDSLEDILALRRELGSVREQIERLAAQQDALGRLVALARVSVELTSREQPTPAKGSLWGDFLADVASAWHDGVSALLGTLAWLILVGVGGAPWLVIGVGLLVLAWRRHRRHSPRALPT